MKQFQLSKVLPTVLILFLMSGCASSPGKQTMAWKAPTAPWKWGILSASKKKPTDTKVEIASIEKAAESDSDTKKSKDRKSKGELKKVTSHNAELLAHINEELKDASPQERAHFLNSFKGVDPDMIRNILRTRRMVNTMEQLAEQKPQISSPPITLPGLGHTQPGDEQSQVIQTGAQGVQPPGQLPSDNSQMYAASNPVRLGNLEAVDTNNDPNLPDIVPTQTQPYSRSQTISQGLDNIPVVGTLKTKLSSALQQGTSALQNGISRTSTAIIGQQETSTTETVAASNSQVSPVEQQSADLNVRPAVNLTELAAGSSQDQLAQLIAVAESEIAQLQIGSTPEEKHHFIERHVYLRMLYLMSGQHERALEAIPGIDPADQEFWQQTFWSVANYFDQEAIPNEADRATQTVAQMRQATARLQEKANLKLKNVAFCHKINSFGSYERFERDEYTPGRPVLVYSEIDNFTSELTAEGSYRTLLKSKIQIFKAGSNGDLVAEIPFETTEDLCRNIRKDYFHSYKFEIPRNISLGPHVMKLTVEDEISKKVATYTQNFTVR
ncbi:hypothetical protein [Gimesia aquarii]|uniref:Uncharacterized protein n=1 Tax=Gimesia aquarii TaxID=2527964 RepID=A0A517W3F0_9PLAN|nr:hypothetical protein [Gimesia aquarii]QDT99782.1 hypothetical protein V144x_52950 [Gimesia aquarii]